jgi:hypothetical protein
MTHHPRVAILIEASLAYGRGLLRGVARYVHTFGPWLVYFGLPGHDAFPPSWLEGWHERLGVVCDDSPPSRAVWALLGTGLLGPVATRGVGGNSNITVGLAAQPTLPPEQREAIVDEKPGWWIWHASLPPSGPHS